MTQGQSAVDEVRALYRSLISRWNERDARGFSALFLDDGNVVGFDGSQMDGREAIEKSLAPIFASHPTRPYVGLVREVRSLSSDVLLLRAVAGMYPPETKRVDPAVNAVHSLVAAKRGSAWRIALFQNTPAALHGRPEAVEALTRELQSAL